MTEEIINLISMGVDIPPDRVVVESLPFAVDTTWEDEIAAWEAYDTTVRQQDLIRTIIIGGVALAIAVLLFLLGLSIIRAVKPPPVLAEGARIDLLADGDLDDEAFLAAEVEARKRAEIDLQAKQPELDSIEGFIEKDPAAVAQLLRNWLTDE